MNKGKQGGNQNNHRKNNQALDDMFSYWIIIDSAAFKGGLELPEREIVKIKQSSGGHLYSRKLLRRLF